MVPKSRIGLMSTEIRANCCILGHATKSAPPNPRPPDSAPPLTQTPLPPLTPHSHHVHAYHHVYNE